MAFTDIRFDLVEKLPVSFQPYAVLMRLDRPTGWWLLLLPAWWAMVLESGGLNGLSGYDIYLLLLFWLGAVVMRGAGCIVNDIWDRDLDAKVERTKARPIASGVIKIWQAVIFLGGLLFLGAFVLVQTNATAFWLGMLSLVFVVSYPYMKRITWWPQAFLGLTFNFGILIGWATMTGTLSIASLVLYIGAFFWTIGYDTIYAHQDIADDEVVGIKSTALLFGDRSKKMVALFYTASWSLLTLGLYMTGGNILSIGLMVLPGAHMMLQILNWQPDSPHSSLHWFKSNVVCGLLILLACLAS